VTIETISLNIYLFLFLCTLFTDTRTYDKRLTLLALHTLFILRVLQTINHFYSGRNWKINFLFYISYLFYIFREKLATLAKA
jgi:hypothetical protein